MNTEPLAVPESVVGRVSQLRTLKRHAQSATRGIPQFVLIEGAPGSGKTHLVRHLLSCLDHFASTTVTLTQQDRRRPGFLAQQLVTTPPASNGLSEEALTDAFRSFLRDVQEPTVIVVENFHCSDPSSAEALGRALRGPLSSPVFIILTIQPTGRPELLRLREYALSHIHASYLHLENFTPDEVRRAVEQISAYPVSEQAAALLHEETGGLPALVAHAARWLAETPPYPGRRMEHAAAEMRNSLMRPEHPVAQPIARYFLRLRPGPRKALEALAVAHSGRSAAAIEQMVGIDHRQLCGLVADGVVEYDAAHYGYRLRYPSWRHTIELLLDPERRAELHRAAAESGNEVENFCHLFEAAQLNGRAEDLQEIASEGTRLARQLELRGNIAEAFELMRKALILHPESPTVDEWVRLGTEHQEKTRLGDPDLREVYSRIPVYAYRQTLCALISLTEGDIPAAAQQLEHLGTGTLHHWNEVQPFCHAVAATALQSMIHGFEFPSELVAAAIALLEEHSEPEPTEPLSQLLGSLASLAAGDITTPLPALGPPGAAAAHAVAAAMRRNRGEIAQAGDQLFAACRGSSSEGDSFTLVHIELAESLFYAARWSESHSCSRLAAERALDTGESPLSLIAYASYAVVPCATGAPLGRRLLEQLEQPSALGSTALSAGVDFIRSMALLGTQRNAEPHSLVQMLRDGRFPWSGTGLLPAVFFARYLAGTRHAYLLDSLLRLAAGPDIPASAALRQYVQTHIRGLMAEDPNEQLQLLLAAAEHLETLVPTAAMGRPETVDWALPQALLALDIGKASAAGKGPGSGPVPQRVKQLLVCAEDTFRACGATMLAETARQLVRKEESPAPAELNLALLTPREKQVTELLSQGLSNREIAERLFVSVRTVEFHLQNTLRKLGVRSRKQLFTTLVTISGKPQVDY